MDAGTGWDVGEGWWAGSTGPVPRCRLRGIFAPAVTSLLDFPGEPGLARRGVISGPIHRPPRPAGVAERQWTGPRATRPFDEGVVDRPAPTRTLAGIHADLPGVEERGERPPPPPRIPGRRRASHDSAGLYPPSFQHATALRVASRHARPAIRPVAEEPVKLMHRTSGRSKNSSADRRPPRPGAWRDHVDHPGRETPPSAHDLRHQQARRHRCFLRRF